ncbi:cytochrome c [Sphingomicrobium marinum]|uniref:cytochrome c n=1 Tax=Sphingomicrobium marinum TaxID=1227950 RepID=UPI00223F42D3|nr:cytochrome c [Sphingomicrobium marinum]
MRPFSCLTLAGLLAGCTMPVEEPVALETAPAAMPASFVGAEAATSDAKRDHGKRLSVVLGCNSCHGADYRGGNYSDDPDGGFIFASNLTRRMADLSDDQLVRLMREGVHPRRDALWYMPAKTLQRLSAPDMDALIAFLRTLEPAGRDWPLPRGGEATEALLDYGIIDQSPALVEEYRRKLPPDRGDAMALGRYVAAVTCSECHGAGLQGSSSAPPLTEVAAMGRERLAMLLRTGTRDDGMSHGVMKFVAVRNLSSLKDAERDALLDYLMTLGPPEIAE